MDLASILNASDDESSDEGADFFGSSIGGTNHHTDDDDSDDKIDLEDILREDEDLVDEDDYMTSFTTYPTKKKTKPRTATLQPSPTSSSTPIPHNNNHTDEEYLLLQTILNESDEDEDEEEDWVSAATGPSAAMMMLSQQYDRSSSLRRLTQPHNSVSDIVESSGSSSNDDDDPNPLLQTMASKRSHATLSIRPTSTNTTSTSTNNCQPGDSTLDRHYHHLNRNSADFNKTTTSATVNNKTTKEETLQETIYRKSMQAAQSSERKLLKSGHREIVSPLMVKRRLRPKIEMTARNLLSSSVSGNSSSTGDNNKNYPKNFAFSGLVENKSMSGVSASLVKHADPNATKVLCGLPTCLAFNSKFIAVGTQKGIILVFDLFEVLRQRFGAQEQAPEAAITSLDLSHNGEAVIAGYTTGMLLVWDTIRGTILRSVSDVHSSPITSVRFLTEFKTVTVDASGLVNKFTFTKNLLWANFSMDTECLLDGTAGQILAMNVLPPYSTVNPHVRPEAYSKVLRNLTLIALSSGRSSFAVAVDPKVNVLHRWAKPPEEKTSTIDGESDKYLPCLSWGWALTTGGGNIVMPVLARAWGCCLQFLVASFPTMDNDHSDEGVDHFPAFGLHNEIDTQAPVVSLEWLNDRSIVFLTTTHEFTLVDTVMLTLLERLDFSGLKLVFAEFALSRSQEKSAARQTFQNSTRYSDDRLLVLCQDELRCISIVGARTRISALEADGEWLEALAFALDHYENTVVSQEDNRREAIRDISRHPEFSKAKSDDEEYLAKLLIRYLNLAVENAPEAGEPTDPYSSIGGGTTTRIDLAQSHFQMLAGVCVEFCVVTRRLDLLFGSIFRRFQTVGFTTVFLDVLEPYILNDKLKYLAPEVMSFFVEHCKATKGIATVERCLLHMDCTIMDFDTILSVLRTNDMYSALFYVFNHGLDDYVTPLEILLEKVFSETDTGGVSLTRKAESVLKSPFERLGYKAILYLQACFAGKTFPRENRIEPEERVQTLKRELVQFLMQESFSPSVHVKKAVNLLPAVGQRSVRFPYIRVLLLVDPKGMFDTLSRALDSDSVLVQGWVDGVPSGNASLSLNKIVADLASIVLPDRAVDQALAESNVFASRGAVNAFLDFTGSFIINGVVQVDKALAFMVITRIANQYELAKDTNERQKYQRKVMDTLSSLPRDSYDPDEVLGVFSRASMHRAALLLHQQVASSWHEAGLDNIDLRSKHFVAAIDCFVEDEDLSFRMGVFDYVKKECSGVPEASSEPGGKPKSLRDALYDRLPKLVHLDPLMTACLVAEQFVDEVDRVIEALESNDRGQGQFLFLRAVISGDLIDADPVAGSVLNLTMEHHHKYLSLMAKLHPEMVYEYLATHDNYRTEECLRLCEQYDIADATAYLLERTGNVNAALQLMLQTLETRMMGLKRTIRGMGIDFIRQKTGGHSFPLVRSQHLSKGVSIELPSKQESDVAGVRRILTVSLDLCERNSGSFNAAGENDSKFGHGELWFNVLDRLINAKGFLRLSKEQPEHASVMAGVLSELLRTTMQRMVSSVPLTDLVRKVTADNSGSRIGELRELVEGLLTTYNFELKVFKGASAAFKGDIQSMRKEKLSYRLAGSNVQSVMNTKLKSTGKLNEFDHFMAHPLYSGGVLRVAPHGNASFARDEHFSPGQQAATGLVDSLKRLRSRKSPDEPSVRTTEVGMQTQIDAQYRNNEVEPVFYSKRVSGSLSEAQHRGRLMTFQ